MGAPYWKHPFPSESTVPSLRTLAELCQRPNVFIQLRPLSWDPNMRREHRVKIDVERRGIVKPSGNCWGIFYDPHRRRAAFFPPSTPVVVVAPSVDPTFSERGIASVRHKATTRSSNKHRPYPSAGPLLPAKNAFIHPSLPPMVLARAGAVIEPHGKSRIDDDLVKLGRRVDDAQGLHYVLLDFPDGSVDLTLLPLIEDNCFMLLFDTGCPVTWVYGNPTQLLETEPVPNQKDSFWQVETGRHLKRQQGAQSYNWKVASLAGGGGKVEFGDGLVTWLKLIEGPARIVKPGATDAFAMDQFNFAVCTAATAEKICTHTDGILGMAHKTMDFGNVNTSDLPAYKLCQQKRCLLGPRFIVALDADPSKSWLVLNSNADESVSQSIPHDPWSDWIPTIDCSLFHWVFNVSGFVTPLKTHQTVSEDGIPLLMPFIVDTGTVYSFFPAHIFESLRLQMGAIRNEGGVPYIFKQNLGRLKQIPFHVEFHVPNSTRPVKVSLGSLDMLVTKERGPLTNTLLCGFQAGAMPARRTRLQGPFADTTDHLPVVPDPGEPQELFILGNLFLRHLVVELQYGGGGSSDEDVGRMRAAPRIRS